MNEIERDNERADYEGEAAAVSETMKPKNEKGKKNERSKSNGGVKDGEESRVVQAMYGT
jgi:hypothetical protein